MFISHDLPVVRALSDEVIVMRAGRVVAHGPAADIFERLQHPTPKRSSPPRSLSKPKGAGRNAAAPQIRGRPVSAR